VGSDKINNEILEIIAISLDFPYRLTERFGYSSRSIFRFVEVLIKEKLIKKYRKDGIYSLRITKKGQRYLLKNNPTRFEASTKRKYCKTEVSKRLRVHRIAETYMAMKEADVRIFKDEKPNIFCEQEIDSVVIEQPSFYSSNEIKEFGPECTKIKYTRAVGVLLTQYNDGFFVYNTENSLMKWSNRSEQKLDGVITGLLMKNQVQVRNFAGLMLGKSMDCAGRALISDGGVKNELFKVDGTFSEFYYIPEGNEGKLLLKLLINQEDRIKLKNTIKNSFRIASEILPFASDGVDTEDRPVLLAYEFDMEKIKKFKSGLEMFEEHGIVICFDFQRRVLEEYFGELARIVTLSKDMVAKELDGWNEK